MDNPQASQRPARRRRLCYPPDFRLSPARIMLQSPRLQIGIGAAVTHPSDKTNLRPGAPVSEGGQLCLNRKILFRHTNKFHF